MKFNLALVIAAVCFNSGIYAACPPLNCPADRDTPVAEYLFENNLLDSSGHGLDAIESTASKPVAYYSGIGGRPGMCAGKFTFNSYTGAALPSCIILNSQGEIEWYHYVTNPAATQSNELLVYSATSGDLYIYSGDAGWFGADFIRVNYSYWNGVANAAEEYGSECLKFGQWQHCSFQWGDFGTRLVVDGEIVAGSFNQWHQGAGENPYIVVGTWQTPNCGFSGYIDDMIFWPCSSHGTETMTPTLTSTKSPTVTCTPTITPTSSITETSTITGTFTPVLSDTVTMTNTLTVTHTSTPTFTVTPTVTITASITPTITATPTQSETRLFGAFPNPAKNTVSIIFSSCCACRAELELLTVSGEKAASLSMAAGAGMNNLGITLKSRTGKPLASGVYIYRLSLVRPGVKTRVFMGKFAVAK